MGSPADLNELSPAPNLSEGVWRQEVGAEPVEESLAKGLAV